MEKKIGIGTNAEVEMNIEKNGDVKVALTGHFNLIEELRKLAAKSDNKLDDKMVDMVALALGVAV